MGSSAPDAPVVPTAGENFSEAIETLLARGPELRELEYLNAQGQLEGLRRLSPEAANISLGFEGQFGDQLRSQQAEALRQTRAADVYNAANLAPAIRQLEAQADPQAAAIRAQLGQQVQQGLNAGASLDPGLRREIQQGIRQGQTARGVDRGSGPISAEAFAVGERANALRNQRQQAAQNFLAMQAGSTVNPLSFASGRAGLTVGQPQAPSGQSQQLGQLFGANQSNNLLQSQLDFNSAQAGQGGGIRGAIGGAAGGAMSGAAIGAAGGPFGALGGAALGGLAGFL